MRNTLVLVASILVLSSAATYGVASLARAVQRARTPAEPTLVCPDVLTAGPDYIGNRVVMSFDVWNAGGETLVLKGISTHCGCSAVEVVRDGRATKVATFAIEPGRHETLRFSVTVGGLPGQPMFNRVDFRTNDPRRPYWEIAAKVERVLYGIHAVPTGLYFGTVAPSDSTELSVDLIEDGGRHYEVERVEVSDPTRLTASLDSPSADGGVPYPGCVIRSTLRVKVDTSRTGTVEGAVRVHIKDFPRSPLVVPVSGTVAGAMILSPSALRLPRDGTQGPNYEGTLLIRGGRNAVLSGVRFQAAPEIACAVTSATSTSAVVKVTWNPRAGSALTGTTQRVGVHARVDGVERTVELPVTFAPGAEP